MEKIYRIGATVTEIDRKFIRSNEQYNIIGLLTKLNFTVKQNCGYYYVVIIPDGWTADITKYHTTFKNNSGSITLCSFIKYEDYDRQGKVSVYGVNPENLKISKTIKKYKSKKIIQSID